jgi:predicted transcriptional regulator
MTVVSSKEFATNQTKYYNLAVSEEVFIKRGKNMFIVSIADDKKRREREVAAFKRITENIYKIIDEEPLPADLFEKEHQKSLKDLKGKISFSDDYDYKLMRS